MNKRWMILVVLSVLVAGISHGRYLVLEDDLDHARNEISTLGNQIDYNKEMSDLVKVQDRTLIQAYEGLLTGWSQDVSFDLYQEALAVSLEYDRDLLLGLRPDFKVWTHGLGVYSEIFAYVDKARSSLDVVYADPSIFVNEEDRALYGLALDDFPGGFAIYNEEEGLEAFDLAEGAVFKLLDRDDDFKERYVDCQTFLDEKNHSGYVMLRVYDGQVIGVTEVYIP